MTTCAVAMNGPSILAAADARPEPMSGATFGTALRFDSRIPAKGPPLSWSVSEHLLQFSRALVRFEVPHFRIPEDHDARNELVTVALLPALRTREQECPVLRDFCHPRVVIDDVDVDLHNCIVHAVSQRGVAQILQELQDPEMQQHLSAIPDDRYLWHVAAYYGFLDGAFRMLAVDNFVTEPDIPVAQVMQLAAGFHPVTRLACHRPHTPQVDPMAELVEEVDEPTAATPETTVIAKPAESEEIADPASDDEHPVLVIAASKSPAAAATETFTTPRESPRDKSTNAGTTVIDLTDASPRSSGTTKSLDSHPASRASRHAT